MIWCLGLYSSGSTWLYNATRAVAAELSAPRHAGFAAKFRELTGLLAADPSAIVKTHELDAKAASLAAKQASAILITLRDPRDAVASLLASMPITPVEALDLVHRSALQIRDFAGDRRARIFRYEDGFIDDPATLDTLAAVLGAQLAPAARAKLFAATRRAEIEAEIARMTAAANPKILDVVDPVSQWHGHHANRTGEVGRWRRELTAEVVAGVEARLGTWMAETGYDKRGDEAAAF